jgi:predicted RNA-binding protein with PIN domain
MKRIILVDVCNLLHAMDDYRGRLGEGIDTLAGELLQQLKPLHDLEHWELHLVVDGRGTRLDQQFEDGSKTLSTIFTPEGTTADAVIESWLMRLGPEWTARVATGDRTIIHTALAHGAESISPDELMGWLSRLQERFSRQQKKRSDNSSSVFGNRLEGL